MANQGGRYEMRDGKRVLIQRTQERKTPANGPKKQTTEVIGNGKTLQEPSISGKN